jgi:phage shock protein A
MPMAKVLQQLEDRLEELLKSHDAAKEQTAVLEARVAELEQQLEQAMADKAALDEELTAAKSGSGKVAKLEDELNTLRKETASRLEKILNRIDEALEDAEADDS